MAYVVPTIAQFKAQFDRDFSFSVPESGIGGDDTDMSKVRNKDITAAINLSQANMNVALFPTQASYVQGSLYLAAHYLVTSLKASSQGLFSQYNWNTIQKSIGSMQESFSIPALIAANPWMSQLTKTQYGAQYLSIIGPLLYGNVAVVRGATTP